MHVILASGSPRRKELLKELFCDFEIIPSDIDEYSDIADPAEFVKSLSRQKAEAVYKNHAGYGDLVIGADTIVVLAGKIIGKPLDRDDAVNMLKSLSGKTHHVYTGVTVIFNDNIISKAEKTVVKIGGIPEDIIYSYVDSGLTMDKAGGYGLQDLGGLVNIQTDGDRDNVIGLPVKLLKQMLTEAGFLFLN